MHTKKNLVLLALAVILLPAGVRAQADPEQPERLPWPRQYSNEEGARLELYQPQVTDWQDTEHLKARVAFAVWPVGAEKPELGTFEIEATTEVDLDTRLVRLTDPKIGRHTFPTLDGAQSQRLLAKLDELLPDDGVVVELDRILASLERSEIQLSAVATKNDPPKIFYSDQEAVLVLFDGEPIWSPIDNNKLQFAVNTNWDVFRLEKKSNYYLRDGKAWYQASSAKGPWSAAAKLPKAFKKLPQDDPNWKEVRANLPDKPSKKAAPGPVPKIFVSEEPAELILTDGEPRLAVIEGTELLVVINTDSDLLLHSPDKRFYYLVSGRWFRADDLEGPWQFATHDLPEDFQNIPDSHPSAHVKHAVPGTAEAQEAIVLAQIPQTATVQRDELTAEVTYAGEPEFKPIEGTDMSYAVNTPNDVIEVDGRYYLCLDGVWFVASSPEGPWMPTDSVPDKIYTIPPSSPVYHTTYVQVYESSPSTVTYGYTSGYYGVYYSSGCMVYGTGWYYYPYYYYPPYYGYPIYYRYPYTYGGGTYYNPYTGTYGRGAYAYGPYGGIGGAAAYNPTTGTYARGAAAYGPYNARGWAEAYNPRTGTYAQTRQGANAYANWGTTSVQRGNEWARTAHYTDSRGTVAGARTSRGGRAIAGSGEQGTGFLGRTGGGDLYAGRNGNVYRRGESGWEQHGEGGWSPVEGSAERTAARQEAANRARESGAGERLRESGAGDRLRESGAADRARQSGAADRARSSGADRGTIQQLDRDRARRTTGSQRSSQYGSWRSSPSTSRPSRGYSGGYGSRGGFSGRAGGGMRGGRR